MLYFKNGKKIHIKESQKGSFTRYCGGNVTSECIARGKASPDPRIRKKATFADNARKWKHQFGGILKNDEIEFYDPMLYYKNAKVDEDSLNPYGSHFFGLEDDNPFIWYKGKKVGSSKDEHDLNVVKTIYGQLQNAIKTNYPKYSPELIDNLADFMVRHYIKENGWEIVNKLVGGYGKAKSVDEWVRGMRTTYPNSMKATTFYDYVEGLKSNYQGNKYNSVNPHYFEELYRDFGGDKVRVGRLLKLVRGI